MGMSQLFINRLDRARPGSLLSETALFWITLKLRHRRRYLLLCPLPAYRATRLKAHDIAVAMPRHQLGNVEVMPPVAPPAMSGQAVVGFS